MKTQKLYYDDLFKKECEATIIDVDGDKIICDKTIAFPEGGGQIGDCGKIICDNGDIIPFIDTKKGVGNILHLNNRYDIQVNTPVYHIIDSKNTDKISSGMNVKIVIDVSHRIKTTVLHSALHIVLMEVVKQRPNLENKIKGCHIDTEKARIDFFSESKFTPKEIVNLNEIVNQLVNEDIKVERFLYQGQQEAWIWKCKDFECPCGGTHVSSTGQLGDVVIKRKNVGKTTERLIVTLNEIKLVEEMYH